MVFNGHIIDSVDPIAAEDDGEDKDNILLCSLLLENPN